MRVPSVRLLHAAQLCTYLFPAVAEGLYGWQYEVGTGLTQYLIRKRSRVGSDGKASCGYCSFDT